MQTKTNNQPNQSSDNSHAEQILVLVQFIERRQQQKQKLTLSKINSLSKYNKKNPKKTKEKNEKSVPKQDGKLENLYQKSSVALNKLVKLLGEQLSEGHTVYTLTKITERQRELFKIWQEQGWLTVLTQGNTKDKTNNVLSGYQPVANTPIVMQVLSNPNLSAINSAEANDGFNQRAVFWLQRQWYAERQLARQLVQIAQRSNEQLDLTEFNTPIINHDKNDKTPSANIEQQRAIDNASRFALSIITGGPGTGKTFTVAKLVTRLQHAHDAALAKQPHLPPLSIALTAPTGKAAQRMQESLLNSLNGEPISLEPAKTLHRLLGIGDTGTPRYYADNPLPYDLVIVDEASMLGLELASLLVDAIKPTARLILLGDANQLAAVDAGSVLADLCQVPALQPYRTELIQSKRFDEKSQVGQLAKAIGQTVNTLSDEQAQQQANCQKWHYVRQLLTKSSFNDSFQRFDSAKKDIQVPIRFYPIDEQTELWPVYQTLAQPYQAFFNLMRTWYVTPPDIEDIATRQQLFHVFDSYRILTAGHQGRLGSEALNKKIGERYTRGAKLGKHLDLDFFYHGMPVMIKHNDYQLGLFNGDIGVCLEVDNTLWICFPDKVINSSRLSRESCDRAYAMTIHKSQGSEFENVAVCLDSMHSRLLSQELVYTAVTRSKGGLMIVSPERLLYRAVLQKGNRQTGLALQF